MEELILAGRITVNRMPAEIGSKVGPGDEVRINGEPVKIRFAEPKPRVLMYHKPSGEIVTRDDPESRTTVFEDLPPIEGGKWIAVGRLDYNTEGLLLFTNSGELANRLMHPRYEVEREYSVRVMGRLSDEQMQQLTTGIELEDGPAKCEKVEDGGGEEEGANHWYNVVLKEGRNREVRRLFEALNVPVSRLIRTRYGRVSMPAAIKRGQTQELDPQAVNALLTASGLRGQGGGQGGAQQQGPRPQQKPGQGKRPGQQGKHSQRRPQGGQGPRPQGPRGPRNEGPRHEETRHEGPYADAPRADTMAEGDDGSLPGDRNGNVAPGQGARREPRHDNRGDNRGNTLHARPQGQKQHKRPQQGGQGKFRGNKGPRSGQGGGQYGQWGGQYGQGGGQGYGGGGHRQRQPWLTGHSQPQGDPAHAQPQLTMHAQQYGRGSNYQGEVNGNTLHPQGKRPPGPNQGPNARFGKRKGGGGGQPPKQKWVGLPKDEDEPQ